MRRSPREVLDTVVDPEIPVLTIADLGILREVTERDSDNSGSGTTVVDVVITPTYSGCPAMDTIAADIRTALGAAGYEDVHVHTVYSPAWTTDWMTEDGKRKLAEFGIAPPGPRPADEPVLLALGRRVTDDVRCPQCGGVGRELSRFGSTSCKALYVCTSCAEPFDHFKAI